MQIKNIVDGLNTYPGRDSVIRVTAYFSLFLYGITEFFKEFLNAKSNIFLLSFISIDLLDNFSLSCKLISKYFATTRLILRIFDDLPAIYRLIEYWKSFSEVVQVKDKSDEQKKKKVYNFKLKNIHLKKY